MKKPGTTLQSMLHVAEKLSLVLDNDFRLGDVLEALFVIWQKEKNMRDLGDLFDIELDVDEAFELLMNFNMKEFVLRTMIETRHYDDILLSFPELEEDGDFEAELILPWRLNRHDAGRLHEVPHLILAEHDIRMDIRTGDCLRKGKFLKRIPLEVLVFVREWMEGEIGDELPPMYIDHLFRLM
jgi:hypothetical protein